MPGLKRLSLLFLAPGFTLFFTLSAWASPIDVDDDLIGKPVPEWTVTDWIHSEPLTLDDLKGNVVLVRFWTGPQCPYCRATAPSLNEFHERYSDRGLRVIGIYHHKSTEPFDKRDVETLAEAFSFHFPIAIDTGWRTLKAWWLNKHPRAWTSVSFLLDRRGIVRAIHPGGQYVEGDEDYRKLEETIQVLLDEEYNGNAKRISNE